MEKEALAERLAALSVQVAELRATVSARSLGGVPTAVPIAGSIHQAEVTAVDSLSGCFVSVPEYGSGFLHLQDIRRDLILLSRPSKEDGRPAKGCKLSPDPGEFCSTAHDVRPSDFLAVGDKVFVECIDSCHGQLFFRMHSCDQVSGVKLQPCLAIPRTSIPIRGIVTVLMEYGALVALPAYRDPSTGEVRTGLLHLKNQGADMCELEQGTSLWVEVLHADPDRNRFSLSTKRVSQETGQLVVQKRKQKQKQKQQQKQSRATARQGVSKKQKQKQKKQRRATLNTVFKPVTVAPVAPVQLDEWGSDDEKYSQKSDDDDDRRSSGCDDDEELWAQGVKPWDNDAGAVLDVLYSY